MKAICNGTDLSALVGYGYSAAQEPQYGESVTALNGKDYTPKLRDRWHLTVPFIALTESQLADVLQLFPTAGAYVSWTFTDQQTGADRTLEFKYAARKANLMVQYRSGLAYWSGLVVDLLER